MFFFSPHPNTPRVFFSMVAEQKAAFGFSQQTALQEPFPRLTDEPWSFSA